MTVLCLCMFTLLPSAALDVVWAGEQDHFKQNNCVSTALLTFESMLNEAGAGWAGAGAGGEHSTAVSVACPVLRAQLSALHMQI